MTFRLERWKDVSAAEREAVAKTLISSLPTGFSFHALSGPNAIFAFESAKFVLIPGGAVCLGFDADRPWIPTEEEAKSWAMTAREYGFSESIHERICAATLRPRQVELPTLLVETETRELGWESTNPDDSEIVSMLKQYPAGFQLCRGGLTIRVRQDAGGLVAAERSMGRTHAEVLADLQKTGFRFPTSDEWEYFCGCGEPTLFRWGDHAPVDRYPTDINPAEAAWRRNWALSAGRLAPPAEGFVRDWDRHVKPNS